MPRAMPVAKMANGVEATPALSAPVPAVFMSENMMPATMIARTPTKDSTTMAPYPTLTASASFSTCLEEVPEDTRLWNPESAPHATETNRTGNIIPEAVVKPVNTGAVIVAWPLAPSTTMPSTAHAIMTIIMMEVR